MNAILTLFRHSWLGFIRSKGLGHKLIETALWGFLALNLAVSLSLAGLVGGELIKGAYPGKDVLQVGLGFIVFYFVVDLLMRYFMQKFPVMGVRPYLVMPLSRKTIVHSMLLRSMFSFWNFLPWFLAIPFYYSVVREFGNATQTMGFFVVVALLTLFNNFLAFALVAMRTHKLLALSVLAGAIALLYFEITGRISFVEPLGEVLLTAISAPWAWLVVMALPVLLYRFLLTHFAKALGEETLRTFDRGFKFDAGLRLFGKYGHVGELVDLEVRLIFRNKRARQYFFTSILFLLVPITMLSGADEWSMGMKLIIAFLLTGIITLNHAQLILSWNSLHFDFLLTRGQSIERIFLAKYYVLVGCCVLSFVLTLPYSFLIPGFMPVACAMLLVNVTVSCFAYMLLAAISSLHVNPNEGGAFSLSGFGIAHYLIVIPIIAMPFVLYGTGYFIAGSWAGLASVATFGMLLFIFHKKISALVARVFAGNRYRIAAALRNK